MDGWCGGGPAVGSGFGEGGAAGRRGLAAGGGSRRFGRWWLAAQGVEFDDKLEALDFVSNGWKI